VPFFVAAKARITLGIALFVAALAVIGREVPWIAILLILFAVFLVIWGKEQRATEAFIKDLPLGSHILKGLDALDSVLTPRDRDHELHIRSVISCYDDQTRAALRKLLQTKNTNTVPTYENKFKADGFIEYPKDGPGWIKPELRDVVARTLNQPG
jgi:hypothetical protein